MALALDKRHSRSRTVKPRKKASNADRSIVVVIDNEYCTEDGVTGGRDQLITDLRRMPLHTVVTATESAGFLKLTQDKWGAVSDFQFRVTPIEREIFTGRTSDRRRLTLSLTSVAWFGWTGEKCGRGNTVRNRYHLLIDPLTFAGRWLDDRSFPAYMRWAQEIRAFCLAQHWNLRPTQGAVARQALTDERFYPHARRKVPRATNQRARDNLPGNHYQLTVTPDPRREYDASYLDQSRSHHYHASQAGLPSCSTLYGYGRFRHPEGANRPYKVSPRRIARFMAGFCGLYYGRIWWPVARRKETVFLPRFLERYGTDSQPANQPVYFFSEDVPLMESLGVRVTAIIAAWGSKERDTGLAAYARWAVAELARDAPQWKKALLLAPYGALATAPGKQTVAYHRSRRGKRKILTTKTGVRLPVSLHTASKESEPTTNNVLHRALIESSNRTETLLYARLLESQGYRVLCVYVDALLVEREDRAPILLAPWRLDRQLTHLRFLSGSQFVSSEIERLPGITGAQRREVAFGQLKGATRIGDRERRERRKVQAFLRQQEKREFS